MRRIKTEIESLKKKEPPRRISELHFFNQPTSQNAKVKLSKLMHNILQPTSPCYIKPKQFNRSIVIEDITQRVKNSNKPSRFIEVKDNQFFRKKEYSQPKLNITFRNTRIIYSTTRKQLLMTTEQQMVNDIMAIPIQKQPCPQNSSKTTYVQPFQEPSKPKLYHIEGSVEKALEDFNNRIFGSSTVKKLINSVKPWVNQMQMKKTTKYKRIRIGMVQLLNHIHKLKLTLEEFAQGNVFPKHPFQKQDSEKFFSYCKMNKSDLVEKMLEADKYLVYEYDPSFMTALHWSCVRNCRAVALLLLRYGADPDAQDMIGRTPLFLALLHTNNDIAQLLLYHKADPWNKGNLNYLESVTNNPEGKSLLQQMRRTHILLRMTPPSQRQYIWQQKQLQMLC